MNARDVQGILFAGADIAGAFYPISEPYIALVEELILKLEGAGVIPLPPTQAMIDAMRATAQAAGEAASEASAATSARAHGK